MMRTSLADRTHLNAIFGLVEIHFLGYVRQHSLDLAGPFGLSPDPPTHAPAKSFESVASPRSSLPTFTPIDYVPVVLLLGTCCREGLDAPSHTEEPNRTLHLHQYSEAFSSPKDSLSTWPPTHHIQRQNRKGPRPKSLCGHGFGQVPLPLN